MNSTRRGGLNSTALALIPLAIAINIAGGQLAKTLRLPIYLDSIGTVLTGALLGPWIGLITGILSNGIWTLSGLDQFAWSFAIVAGVIGLMAGFAGRLGVFQRPSPRWLSAIIGGMFFFALTMFVMFFINAVTDADGNTVLPVASDLIGQNPIVFTVAILAGIAARLLRVAERRLRRASRADHRRGSSDRFGTDRSVSVRRCHGIGHRRVGGCISRQRRKHSGLSIRAGHGLRPIR